MTYRARYHFLLFLRAFRRQDMSCAAANAREAAELADAAGVSLCRALYRLGLAHALFARGDRRKSLSVLAQARRIARGIPTIEWSCISTTTYFLLERGRTSMALPFLRRTLELARKRGDGNPTFWIPELMTRLYSTALEHGIEMQYVQHSIRERSLAPTPEVSHLEHWPRPVRIYTLGCFSVLVDGRVLEFKGKAQRRSLELLMALVAFGGRDVGEHELIDALWSASEGDKSHQACASTLHRLRKLLRCSDAIRLQGGHFSLDPRYVWVDVWAFEHGLSTDGGEAADRAIALYRGPFLGKYTELMWTEPLRIRLRSKFLRHMADRGHALLAAEKFESAIALFERALDVEPIAEDLYQGLMLCYRAMDRRAEAVAAYRRCEKMLAAVAGVLPGGKTIALYRELQTPRCGAASSALQ